jgi:DNA-binding CsgD family transcriptional regulator
VPVEAERPDAAYERKEVEDRVRGAIATLPPRERRVIALYYYGEVTMKEIGAELGVNESRVSQLHARALRRLREALGPDVQPMASIEALRNAVVAFEHRPRMAKADLPASDSVVSPAAAARASRRGVVIDYASASRAARSKSPSRNGLESHRHPLSSRKRSASVPATSPVTKMTRRASAGVAAVMAR